MRNFQNFTALLNIWLQTKLLLSTKEGSFSDSKYPRNTNILGSKFTNCVTRLDTRMIWQFIWAETDNTLRNTWLQLTRQCQNWQKIQGRGHKLYMDNYFYSPDLFDDLVMKQIYCCGTVRPNRKGKPWDLGPKRLTRGDLQVQTRGYLTTILWRDKQDVRVLTNTWSTSRG